MPGARSLLATAVLVVAVGAGCGGTAEDASADTAELTEQATARSLVAAVAHHLDRPAKLAAPLFPSDLFPRHPKRVPDGALGVEVAFDEEVGDNSHVRLVVWPDPAAFDEYGCDGEEMQDSTGCEETTTGDGAEQRLAWGAFTPEEDPGYIQADFRRDDLIVSVFYYGKEIPGDLRDSVLAGLADDLVALAADPAVGVKTTAAYAEAGAAIDDDVMLDWYGQGNGYPRPPDYEGDA